MADRPRRAYHPPAETAARDARVIAMSRAGVSAGEVAEAEGLTYAYTIKLKSKLRREGADIPKHLSKGGGGAPAVVLPLARATGMMGRCPTTVYSRDLADAEAELARLEAP